MQTVAGIQPSVIWIQVIFWMCSWIIACDYRHVSSFHMTIGHCTVTKSCPIFCIPRDCSTPGFLSFTISQSFLKLMSVESVMPSKPSHPLSSPSPTLNLSQHWRPMSQLLKSDGQSIGALASILPTNIQGWFPGWLFSPLKPVVGDNPSCPGMGESA